LLLTVGLLIMINGEDQDILRVPFGISSIVSCHSHDDVVLVHHRP
jgi:hypothetical protein